MDSQKSVGRLSLAKFVAVRPSAKKEEWNRPLVLICLAVGLTTGIYGIRQYLRQPLLSLDLLQFNQTLALTEFTGKIQPAQEFKVVAAVPGIVREKYVKAGDRVLPGEPLLALENLDSKQTSEQLQQEQESLFQQITQLKQKIAAFTQAAAVDARLNQANQELSKAQLRSQQVPLHQRQDSVDRAQATYDLAFSRYQRMEMLSQEGAISQAVFDQAKAEWQIAQADLNSAQAAAKTLAAIAQQQEQQYSVQQDLLFAQQTQQLSELQGQLEAAQLQYAQVTRKLEKLRLQWIAASQEGDINNFQTLVRASQAGVVTELPATTGDQILAGTELAKVVQLDQLKVKVPVTVRLVNTLQLNQKALVKLGVEGEAQEFTAKVVTINPVPSDDLNYAVEVQFKNPNHQLLVGQSAKVQFLSQ